MRCASAIPLSQPWLLDQYPTSLPYAVPVEVEHCGWLHLGSLAGQLPRRLTGRRRAGEESSIRVFRNEVKLFLQSLNALWLGLKANQGHFLHCDSFKPAFQFECDSCVLYLNSNVNNFSIILRIIQKHQDKQEEKGLQVIFQSQEIPDMVYSTSSTKDS